MIELKMEDVSFTCIHGEEIIYTGHIPLLIPAKMIDPVGDMLPRKFIFNVNQMGSILRLIKCSKQFRLKYSKYLITNHFIRKTNHRLSSRDCHSCGHLDTKCCFDVHLISLLPDLDYSWGYKLMKLVVIRFKVEDSLAWLNTLGGAYSCLGEQDRRCAKIAGDISVTQLEIACQCGDPSIISRCGIYMVYSLCQRGLNTQASRLIKHYIHPYISKMIINKCCDKILKNMYKAACFRVKSFKSG